MTNDSIIHHGDLLRMPFDQFGRYQIMAEVANALRASLGVDQLRILDVGGYQVDERFGERLPLTLFLPHDDIEALDTIASDLPKYHQGDGTAMRFEDGAYDLVVTADTLEHIPAALRPKFIGELCRVCRYGVVLVAPFFSPETELAELVLERYFKAELRYKHPFLQEHRDFGLPEVQQTEDWFTEQGQITSNFPSGYVHSWLEMMVLRTLLWRLTSDDSLVGALEEYYNRVLSPLERREPAYRHLIVAAPAGNPLLLELARRTLAPTIHQPTAQPSSHEQFLQQFLLQLMPMGLLDRMRTDDEATVTHWQSQAHHWHSEANRVQLDRQAFETELIAVRQQLQQANLTLVEAQKKIQRLEQARRDLEQERRHWEHEAHRVELVRRNLEQDPSRWESEAHRVELARQALEQECVLLKQECALLKHQLARRNRWQVLVQRSWARWMRSRSK